MTLQPFFFQMIQRTLIVLLAGTFFVIEVQPTSAKDAPLIKSNCPRLVLNSSVTFRKLFKNTISRENSHPLYRAMSQLWLKDNVRQANKTLIREFEHLRGDVKTLTPEIADNKFKWQMRIWLRIYGLFNSRDGRFHGRLYPKTEAVFHELFWNYSLAKSTLNRADPRFIWFIQGSENHDLMDLSNAFLALEALQKVPQYSKRSLSDGHTIDEHVKAWTAYYCQYADQRVARGLLIECGSSIYGKYAVPELVNMADFADSAVLRRKMTMFLDVLWADWAIEQIDGIRGGGKSRVYQGRYSQEGHHDSFLNMGNILLGRGHWPQSKHSHTNSGYVYCLATSRYRLPVVIAKLATKRPNQPYTSISRRPAKMTAIEILPEIQPHSCCYFMDPDDTRATRYTYCTPDYIMGSWWVDPSLEVSCNVEKENQTNYAAIHAQNRWQGIIFRGDLNTRIFPQCFSTRADKNDSRESVTNHQQIAVQHKNVMIVQANLKSKKLISMRIYFAPSIRDNLVKHNSWLVAQVGHTFAATAAIDSNAKFVGGEWKRENFFHINDLSAPVLFVTSDQNQFKTIVEFKNYLDSIECTAVDNVLNVRFRDADNQPAELKFDCKQKTLPSVNGQTINLNPDKVYDSPYLMSDFGSGVVTIGQGKKTYVWNMNNNSIRKKSALKH